MLLVKKYQFMSLPRKLRITVLMQQYDERRAASEIVVTYSCGRMFLALV